MTTSSKRSKCALGAEDESGDVDGLVGDDEEASADGLKIAQQLCGAGEVRRHAPAFGVVAGAEGAFEAVQVSLAEMRSELREDDADGRADAAAEVGVLGLAGRRR